MAKKIFYTYGKDKDMNIDMEKQSAQEACDEIRVLSGVLFQLLDREMDNLSSADVDLSYLWEMLGSCWDALYVIKQDGGEEEQEEN